MYRRAKLYITFSAPGSGPFSSSVRSIYSAARITYVRFIFFLWMHPHSHICLHYQILLSLLRLPLSGGPNWTYRWSRSSWRGRFVACGVRRKGCGAVDANPIYPPAYDPLAPVFGFYWVGETCPSCHATVTSAGIRRPLQARSFSVHRWNLCPKIDSVMRTLRKGILCMSLFSSLYLQHNIVQIPPQLLTAFIFPETKMTHQSIDPLVATLTCWIAVAPALAFFFTSLCH